MSTLTINEISPAELNARLAGEIDLVDVRTPAEFGSAHVRGARNVPLDQLDPAEFRTAAGPVYVVCQSGGRSKKAAEMLGSAGVKVVNVLGGTSACDAGGLPMVRGRRVMSLERQVRIAAGAMVLAGIGLGLGVHAGFLGLSAFVGAGLVFAGITDTCGMAMLLGKMPWNRINVSTCTPRPS